MLGLIRIISSEVGGGGTLSVIQIFGSLIQIFGKVERRGTLGLIQISVEVRRGGTLGLIKVSGEEGGGGTL